MSSCWLVSLSACLVLALLAVMLGSSSTSALPLDEDSIELDEDKRSPIFLPKYYSKLRGLQSGSDFDSSSRFNDLDFPAAYASQKRRSAAALLRQSRSGGMSICLWKVCPAAPWLVQK